MKDLVYLISICNREHIFQAAINLLIALNIKSDFVLLDDLDPTCYQFILLM